MKEIRIFSRAKAVLALFIAASATTAMANTITFAAFNDFTFGPPIWTISSSPGGCTTGSGCTTAISVTSPGPASFNSLFTFLPASLVTPLVFGQTISGPTDLSFSASSTSIGGCAATCAPGDTITINNFTGGFSFIGSAAAGPDAGKNYLSATFTNASLTAKIGNNTGSVTYTLSVPPLTMTSDFLNFNSPPQTEEDIAISWTSVNPNFGITTPNASDQAYLAPGSYSATGAGTFATVPGFAPEPGSIVLMSAGAGILAFLARRRRVPANQ